MAPLARAALALLGKLSLSQPLGSVPAALGRSGARAVPAAARGRAAAAGHTQPAAALGTHLLRGCNFWAMF